MHGGPVRRATTIVLAVAMAAGWAWTGYALQSERADHQATKADHAERRQMATAAALANERRIRELEQELTDASDTHAQTQRELAAERAARAADARAFDGRLRSAAKTYASTAGARCANPTPAANEPTAAEALDLLAGLLDRVANRTTELAAFAEDAHAAAAACAADYDRAREALSSR